MADMTGDWVRAIRQLSGVLVTVGRLFPSTVVPVTLCAEDFEGRRYVGETSVNECRPPIPRIWLEPLDAEPLPEALLAIMQADLIILAPGSLYTSIVSNLLIRELRLAIARSEVPVIYVANLMTEPGESSGLDLETHVAPLPGGGRVSARDHPGDLVRRPRFFPAVAGSGSPAGPPPSLAAEPGDQGNDRILIVLRSGIR
jgi:uncharacterized cofD-like protein